MTVIAWDGRTLAADKRAVSGGGIARTVTKIERHGACLIAITGDWDTGAEMREWFKAGADIERFPPKARDDRSTMIVINPDGIRTWATGPYPMAIEQGRCCWGSGRDFAEAVLFIGYDARKAVEVACHFQTDCGNGIDTLELDSE